KPAKELQAPSGLKPLAKVRDVSDYLNAPASTIYSLCYRGELPFFRVGKSYRFDMEAIRLHVTGA
ncbi:MAG: helix-turn-helix domain-containing protein, partial [Verrucomicrobia bacterium]|nr:helix-turn-helix domain-containing protein [Verrucomicrobiota bacterium]